MSSLVRSYSQKAHNAHAENDTHAFLDAWKEWQDKNCPHAEMSRVFDAHTGAYSFIRIPCGKCYHCRMTHINEWVTRMYAHLEDYKNVYFITLTYRPIYHKDDPKSQLLLNRLQDAIYHYDGFNSNKKRCYSPCLLVKSHYQKFLKRLRYNTGISDLTYCLSGEYGENYGRPHFHFILFTNETLTKKDIQRAWSVAMVRDKQHKWKYKTCQKGTTYYHPIGNVDFNNLCENGTLNTTEKIKIDGTTFDITSCFAYVAKYICKTGHHNKSRVRLAYNDLFKENTYLKLWKPMLKSDALRFIKEHDIKISQTTLKTLTYVQNDFNPNEKVYTNNLQPCKKFSINEAEFAIQTLPADYDDFVALYSPFFEVSRGTPIGSIYSRNHLQEHTQGVFTHPLLQTKGFVVPAYFRHKAAQALYPLRRVSQNVSGYSFNLGNIPNLLRQFEDILSEPVARMHYSTTCDDTKSIAQNIKSPTSLYDVSTKDYIVFTHRKGVPIFEKYRYNRAKKDYELTFASTDVTTICLQYIQLIKDELTRHDKIKRETLENYHLLDRCSLLGSDLGIDWQDTLDTYLYNQDIELKHKQAEYDSVHNYIE